MRPKKNGRSPQLNLLYPGLEDLLSQKHGIGFEMPLQKWFDFKIPKTLIPKNYIERAIDVSEDKEIKASSKVIWLGTIRFYTKNKKGKVSAMSALVFCTKKEDIEINLKEDLGKWLFALLEKCAPMHKTKMTFEQLQTGFIENNLGDFTVFLKGFTMAQLRDYGLIIV